MKERFVKINGNIIDYKQYIREVEFLKYEIKRRILDLLEKEFIILKNVEENEFNLMLTLYNKRLDLRFEIECAKLKPLKFIW